ncbi:MAG TPA: hypothetical protein DC057_14965 [Spirochaetia bacterium]|nr:hypothetical protein [Spirochaetia bacterium]
MINIIKGYAAINLNTFDYSKQQKWIGIIQGNISCKQPHRNVKLALKDAKKLFKKLIESKFIKKI